MASSVQDPRPITATLRVTSEYKALTPFLWREIPRLAILTGFNGVGKTQLLEMIVTQSAFKSPFELDPPLHAAGYLPALWDLRGAKVSHEFFRPVEDLARQLELASRTSVPVLERIEGFFNSLNQTRKLPDPIVRRVAQALQTRGKLKPPISRADVIAELHVYDLVAGDPTEPLTPLAQACYSYVNAQFTAIQRGAPRDQMESDLGRPPWELVNELLQLFGVNFSVTSPDDLRFGYELKCRLPGQEVAVDPGELSSGEQAVLALVALAVLTSLPTGTSEATQREAQLLLLDEPDAHLHTSLVKSYLEHLAQLTDRGMHVIMVTHRLDTIALAPEGSLFELRRDGTTGATSIVKVESRAEIIGRLAADTVAVLPGVRVVLVEDEDDRRFHQWAYDRAIELSVLPANPGLVFMPVVAKGGGGKAAVIQRLEILRSKGLGAVHRGLVDGDNDTEPEPPGVVRLSRYALENYLADPIALYCAIVNSPAIDVELECSKVGGVDRGHLGALRSRDEGSLQEIANIVISKLQRDGAATDSGRRQIRILGERGPMLLHYPDWIFTMTKERIRALVNDSLHKGLLKEHFHGGPELSGLLPEDLVESYRRLIIDRS